MLNLQLAHEISLIILGYLSFKNRKIISPSPSRKSKYLVVINKKKHVDNDIYQNSNTFGCEGLRVLGNMQAEYRFMLVR